MTLPKRLYLLALPALLAAVSCESGARARQRAFLEAGHQLQRQAAPPSHDALHGELALFIERDIARVLERTRLQGEKDLDLYRKIWRIGSAAALLGGTSGTIASNDGLRFGLSGVGLAAALGGFVLWQVRTHDVADCKAFLELNEKDLRAWERVTLRASPEPVARDVWEEYLAKTAAIRRHETCLRMRE